MTDEKLLQEDYDRYYIERQKFKESEQNAGDCSDYCYCGALLNDEGHCKYCG